MSSNALDGQTIAAANVSPRLAKDERAEYKVVGVSFRQENFERLRKLLGKDPGEESTVRVILRHEPENTKSPSRSAVAVYSEGLHLGHIPESGAPTFANLLRGESGLARADARIYFGNDGPNSLQLRIELPPRFEHQERKDNGMSMLQGDGHYSFPMRTKKYPVFWELLSERKAKVSVLEVGESYFGDDGVLTIGEFGRSPYFFCHYGYIAKPNRADESKVNEHLALLGGQARVSYKLTRTGSDSHVLSLDWDVNFRGKSTQANRSSKIVVTVSEPNIESRPLRWPGEPDPESFQYPQSRFGRSRQNDRFDGTREFVTKALLFVGKAVLYITAGIFILAFLVVKDSLKGATKGKKRK